MSLSDQETMLRSALQEILDMGCPFGPAGDELAKAQRIASEALSGRYPEPLRVQGASDEERA